MKEGETNEPEEANEKSVAPLQENDKNETKQTMYEIAKGELHYVLLPSYFSVNSVYSCN